jgi:hypothetical protein
MARSEDDQGLVTFEVPPDSVGREAEALSRASLVAILKRFKAILDGKRKLDNGKIWSSYRGVPLFIEEINGELMIYAVEDLGGKPPACKINVMFAGLRRLGCAAGAARWDGSNDEILWTDVVLPRCQQHFR